MAKITLASILSSFASVTTLNNNFTKIAQAFENTLSRNGASPNHMLTSMDMNSNKIYNLGAPVNPNDAARYQDVVDAAGGLAGSVMIADGSVTAVELTNTPSELVAITDKLLTSAGVTGATNRPVGDKLDEFMSVKDFGALGNGVANDTVALQAAIDASCAAGKTLWLPAGVYLTTGITTPIGSAGKFLFQGEPGAVLAAYQNNVNILTIGYDFTRAGYRSIRDIKFDGNTKTGVKGIVYAGDNALLYLTLDNVFITRCAEGMATKNVQEMDLRNVTFYLNTTGYVAESSNTDGGMTALSFNNVKFQQNYVGLFMWSNSIYPAGPMNFNNVLFQNNDLTGVALFGGATSAGLILTLQFNTVYLENNGSGTTFGATTTIRGKTIPRCGMYTNNAHVMITGGLFGENVVDQPPLNAANYSIVKIADIEMGGGSKTQTVCDSTSRILTTGVVMMTGGVHGIYDWSGLYYVDGGGGLLSGTPFIQDTRYLKNTYTGSGLTPVTPNPAFVNGAANATATDPVYGTVRQISFTAVANNLGANSAMFNVIRQSLTTSTPVAVSVLARVTSGTHDIIFRAQGVDGTLCGAPTATLTTEWKRVVVYGTPAASEATGYEFYVLPAGTGSPVVQLSSIMGVNDTVSRTPDKVNQMIRQGLFDDMV